MRSLLQSALAQPTNVLTTEQLKSAWLNCEPVEFGDPVLAHTELPFQQTYYPLGFPVMVSTNSSDVLDAAEESWGMFSKMFETPPLMLQVTVTSGGSRVCPPTPVWRGRDHLCSNVADAENFSVSDLSVGHSHMWVTPAAVEHRDYFRYFFLESSAMGGISMLYATAVHAACVALEGTGILLCGDSGAGKTTLSYACARAGFTYVTDDGSYLVHNRDGRLVVGNCEQVRFRPAAAELFPELNGRGIMERAGVGKPSIEMATSENHRIVRSCTANISRIVFLRRNVQRQELAAFPAAVARLYMMQSVHCMPGSNASQSEALDHLLQLGALELRYNDLDWAVKRLQLLASQGD